MHNCSTTYAPIVKGDKLRAFQCPMNLLEIVQMKSILLLQLSEAS
jgi:hypothetical protein